MINDPGRTGAWLSVAFWRVVSVPKSTYSPATVWTARAWTTFRRRSETTGGGSNWPWTIRSRSQSRPGRVEAQRRSGVPDGRDGEHHDPALDQAEGAVGDDRGGLERAEPPSYASQTRVGVGTAGRGVSPP